MWDGGSYTKHKVNGSLAGRDIHFALVHQGGFWEDRGFDQKPEEWVGQGEEGQRDQTV